MTSASFDLSVFEPDRLLALVGDEVLALDTLRDFIADAPALLRRIEQAALAEGDGPTLDKLAHRLKGSALQISGDALGAACGRLVTEYTPATTPLETRLSALRVEHARLQEALAAYLAAAS